MQRFLSFNQGILSIPNTLPNFINTLLSLLVFGTYFHESVTCSIFAVNLDAKTKKCLSYQNFDKSNPSQKVWNGSRRKPLKMKGKRKQDSYGRSRWSDFSSSARNQEESVEVSRLIWLRYFLCRISDISRWVPNRKSSFLQDFSPKIHKQCFQNFRLGNVIQSSK